MDLDRVAVIIPALDEEASLPLVLGGLAALDLIGSTVVVDNGSRDGTALAAAACGARVVCEPRRGYGAACLRGIQVADEEMPDAGIVVFLDADCSAEPAEMPALLRPIRENGFDLVIGTRTAGLAEPGALLAHQRLGNAFACGLIRLLFGRRYTDLGPFRAIRRSALRRLGMCDMDFGWTAEMQVKAVLRGLRIAEVPVICRRRVGISKISGTAGGSARAALKIGWTVASLRIRGGREGA